jgi:hypothetical protein
MAVPLEPFHLLGERKPIVRDLFKRAFDVWLGCSPCPLPSLDAATAILFGPRAHLTSFVMQSGIIRCAAHCSTSAIACRPSALQSGGCAARLYFPVLFARIAVFIVNNNRAMGADA